MLVSYLRKTDMEVYSFKGQEVKKIASGSPDSIKPFTAWGKKVLIVGKDMLLFTRKRYPPTTPENIAKAIKMEIKDILPIKDPDFSFKIFEQTTTYSLVNIWAWDCSNYEEIRKVFPFTHILPEDAAFIPEEPEITVFEGNGLQHLIACSKNGFLGGLSLRNLTDKDFETFLKSLGRYAKGIKGIRCYIDGTRLSFPKTLPIVHEAQKDSLPCLKDIKKLNFKEFRFTHERPFNFNIDLVARGIIYFLIVFSISLFITEKNYDNAINETLAKSNGFKDELSKVARTDDIEDYSETINALKEKRKTRVNILAIMDILAESIPEGTYFTRLSLSENMLELTLSSEYPLDVMEALSMARCVKSVKLKGSPTRGRSGKLYTFLLTAVLKPCR